MRAQGVSIERTPWGIRQSSPVVVEKTLIYYYAEDAKPVKPQRPPRGKNLPACKTWEVSGYSI